MAKRGNLPFAPRRVDMIEGRRKANQGGERRRILLLFRLADPFLEMFERHSANSLRSASPC